MKSLRLEEDEKKEWEEGKTVRSLSFVFPEHSIRSLLPVPKDGLKKGEKKGGKRRAYLISLH